MLAHCVTLSIARFGGAPPVMLPLGGRSGLFRSIDPVPCILFWMADGYMVLPLTERAFLGFQNCLQPDKARALPALVAARDVTLAVFTLGFSLPLQQSGGKDFISLKERQDSTADSRAETERVRDPRRTQTFLQQFPGWPTSFAGCDIHTESRQSSPSARQAKRPLVSGVGP